MTPEEEAAAKAEAAKKQTEQKVDPPKKDENKKDDGKKSSILDEIEKDFIKDLKDKIKVEQYADLDQEVRIRIFRGMKADLAKLEAKTPPIDPNKEKGIATDPTAPPATPESGYISNLQKNNMKDFLADIRKNSSVHNITSKIRGK